MRAGRGRRAAPVALALALACGAASTPDQELWTWFAEHARQLSWVSGTRSDPLVEELARRLARVDPGLDYELRGEPGGARELVISADGVARLFPVVSRLVEGAPPIEGWTPVAFRPPRGSGFSIEYEGFVLEPDELWFSTLEGSPPALRVYSPGVGGPQHRLAVEAARLLLQTVVGEYELVRGVSKLEHRALPADPEASGLQPVSALPDALDAAASG